eukprot:224717-Amphidinium_carterae.1
MSLSCSEHMVLHKVSARAMEPHLPGGHIGKGVDHDLGPGIPVVSHLRGFGEWILYTRHGNNYGHYGIITKLIPQN